MYHQTRIVQIRIIVPIVISDLSKSGQQSGGLLQLQEGWKKAEQRLSKTGFFSH